MLQPKTGTVFVKIADIDIGERAREDLGDILALATSIRENGLMNPIILSKEGLKLVAGLRRIEAYKRLDLKEIEARYYENLSPFEIKKLELEENITHKKVMSWQEEVRLKNALHALYLEEHKHENRMRKKHEAKAWGQKQTAEVLGIATSTLSEELRLAKALETFPELAKVSSKKDAIRKMYRLREFALLQEQAHRAALKGDLSDPVQLINGDALKLLPELDDNTVDLVITDPPWGIDLIDLSGAGANEYRMFTDTKDTALKLYQDSIPHLYRVLRPGCHLYLFFDIAAYSDIHGWLIAAGFDVRLLPMIWIKDRPGYTDWEYKPMPQYESFFFCMKPEKDGRAPRRLTEATSDVLVYQRSAEKKLHPTEKPVELMKRLVTLSSGEGELVLDPFAGSASVLRAAYLTKRKALGFEIDTEIYETAKGNLDNLKITSIIDEETELETKAKPEVANR